MSIEWMVIRGSGAVAFALLAGSTIWGLLLTTKILGSWARAKPLTWFHESLAVGAVMATLVHMFTLSIHDFVDFSWAEILVPARSDWRPTAIALGVVGFYGLVLLSVSFYLKRFVGQRGWRMIHFAAFGVFVSTALHGILSGTDSGEPWMVGLYAISILAVASLVAVRFAQQKRLDLAAEDVVPSIGHGEVRARGSVG